MYWTQAAFRELYESLLEPHAESVFDDVLRPWLDRNEEEVRFLNELAMRKGEPWPEATDEELCRLYAAARVIEILLLRFQPANDAASWAGPDIDLGCYVRFTTQLGFLPVHRPMFEPFFHEIVSVESAARHEPIAIATEHWPALMLGDMLFSRAGCSIRAGANDIDPAIATSSRLYWAHRRRNRPVEDLSVGWGSNSQWRTRFRRDYRIGGMLHFNVDGNIDPRQPPRLNTRWGPHPQDELTAEERIELLTHRCFVRCARQCDDLWPWDDRCALPASGP